MEYFFRPVIMKFLMEKGTARPFSLPPISKKAGLLQRHFLSYLNTCEGRLSTPEEIDYLLSDDGLIPLVRKFIRNHRSG